MDQSLWQTLGAFDLLHSSHMWSQTILPCGKHGSALSRGIVPRPRLCTYTHQNSVLKSLRTFFSDGWDLREHLQRKARQAIINWKFNSERITSEWVQHGDPKFGTKKFRICNIWVTVWLWTSKMTVIGSQSEQAQREIIHLCSELKMKNHFHQECYARRCREIEDFVLRRCYQEENTENNEDRKNFHTQHDQGSRTVSL